MTSRRGAVRIVCGHPAATLLTASVMRPFCQRADWVESSVWDTRAESRRGPSHTYRDKQAIR